LYVEEKGWFADRKFMDGMDPVDEMDGVDGGYG
jgi:hypothetical protein